MADHDRRTPAAGAVGLHPDTAISVGEALEAGRVEDARAHAAGLHFSEAADLLEQLDPDRRARLVDALAPGFPPEILPQLEETVRGEVAGRLDTKHLAGAIARLESDDALLLLTSLEESRQRRLMQAIPAALRAVLEQGLAYPEDSAGRLMQRDLVAVPTFWTVGETIDYLREADSLPDDFYDIFIVDPGHRPVGAVALSRVLRTRRPVPMEALTRREIVAVPAAMDQEEVAYLFAEKDLVSAPVVDGGGRLIGAVTIDDVVDVIHEEAEEDLMRLGGVAETDIYEAALDTGKARFSWLLVNLLTAVAASVVIGLFQTTIERLVILAVLMPIAASMGGNAGTQSLTVAVRAIAMRDLTSANALRVLSKEALVGLLNGLGFAAIVGVIAWVWSGEASIGAVMAAAMAVTLAIAGLAGAAIPFGLSRTGIDPAVASGVLVTTVTDVIAFFAFLGLAAWLLL